MSTGNVEIDAMLAADNALDSLDEAGKYRVMQWLANKHLQNSPALKLATPGLVGAVGESDDELHGAIKEGELAGDREFSDFPSLFFSCDAKDNVEKALLAAYWLQVVQGQSQWKGSELNGVLKPTGHGIDRMDSVTKALVETKPRRAIQVTKAATKSGHGHRVMKLTDHGVTVVKEILNRKVA